ncbi:hypothetical protein [Kocuria sabuli]|uniref:hypothetical protein n=1 Tax=Kocuria sabuli TaxID=3071448 RepID=UPI0034D694FB
MDYMLSASRDKGKGVATFERHQRNRSSLPKGRLEFEPMPEPDNESDDLAVLFHYQRRPIGYIYRPYSERLQPWLMQLHDRGDRLIVPGWMKRIGGPEEHLIDFEELRIVWPTPQIVAWLVKKQPASQSISFARAHDAGETLIGRGY